VISTFTTAEGDELTQVTDYRQAGFDSLYDELEWRGLIAQTSDEERLKKTLDGDPISFYTGFDPTAPSIHIGNLVQVLVMRHLQAAGHHPIVLVGGATGLIGDPRQSGERTLNPADTVAQWVEKLRGQISRFLVTDGDNPARFVSNYDWTSKLSAIDFLREIGKNFRMGPMLARDIVARRLASPEGISYAEFSYQILQANDFLHLYDAEHVVLQTGGNDQWGNLTGGLDLIHRLRGVDVNVMTSPIITDSQGKKFGKSEGNAMWLDGSMLSPYKFYQFWLNQPDDQVVKLLKAFTFLPKQRIEELARQVEEDPGARQAQKVLAEQVTGFVHGDAAVDEAVSASQALFGRGGDLEGLSAGTLEAALEGLKNVTEQNGTRSFATAKPGDGVAAAAKAAGLFPSVSKAMKAIGQGGVYINNKRVAETSATLKDEDFLGGRFVVLRRGKKALGALEATK
jgi:tyrosyl-tRNA synthetase